MPLHHEQAPTAPPELSADEKALYDLARLNEWRAIQHKTVDDLLLVDGSLNHDAGKQFEESFDSLLDDYLESGGVDSDSANYTEVRALYADASINKINDDKWNNKPSHRGEIVPNDRSHSQIFAERIAERVGPSVDPESDDEPGGDTEEERRVERLEKLKKAKQEAYVDRVNSSWVGRKEANRAYEQAEAAYSAALKEDIRKQLDDQLAPDVSELQRKQFISDLGEQLLEADDQAQYDRLIEKGGWRARMLAKYDKLSRGKKIGVGLLMAGGGAALGFVAGAAGAATAAVVGGVGVYRFGYNKFFGASRMYGEPRRGNDEKFEYNDAVSASPEEQIIGSINATTRGRIERAEKIRKRAIRNGVAAAAIGGTFGAAGMLLHAGEVSVPGTDMSFGKNDGHWRGGYIEHIFDNDASAHNEADTDGGSAVEDRPDRGAESDNEDSADDSDGSDAGVGVGDRSSGIGTSDALGIGETVGDLGDDASAELEIPTYVVSSGEGFYTTFDNLGIDSSGHAELLQAVGPQLQEMGVAYRMPDGLWGISAAGELPHEATELIMTTAQENGWLAEADTSGEVYDVNAPFDVEHGHGYTHELAQAAATNGVDVTGDQVWEAHKEMIDRHGEYITLSDSSTSTYSMGDSQYEVGIAAPGEATWNPDAQPTINDFLDDGVINGSVEVSEVTAEATAPDQLDREFIEGAASDEPGAVVVDQESLYPAESAEESAEVADGTLAEQLDDIQRAYVNREISRMVEAGNFSGLNQLEYLAEQRGLSGPQIDMIRESLDDLGAQVSDMYYSDGTTAVATRSGGSYVFNNVPTGFRMPNDAPEIFNETLRELGLREYSAEQYNASYAESLRPGA